jgi:flagellar basal-body rod protein FlgC
VYGSLDISVSGMIAQRTRLEAAVANIANKDSYLDSQNRVNPYRARKVMLAPGDPAAKTGIGRRLGVHVQQIQIDQNAVKLKAEPGNPYAYQDGPNRGYLPVPDIDPVTEHINAMEAERAYQANVAAAEATKSMMAQALRLLA